MHIFFATDGSPSAGFALAHILALPWPPPVHVTVMTAVNVPQPRFTSLTPVARRAYGTALATLRREAEATAEKAIMEGRRALEPHVASVATRIHKGEPGPVIVETAKACRADLVAVGCRGLGAIKRFTLGSVSDHVVRHAPCSVLLAKCPPEGDRLFLLAMDGSVHAQTALRILTDLDLSPEAWIHVVVVVESVRTPSSTDSWDRRREEKAAVPGRPGAEGTVAEELVAEARQRLGARGVRVTGAVRRGHAVSEILAAVREFGPQVVVLGAKGSHSPPESPLGRVASKVIRHASCAALIVRPCGSQLVPG